MFKPGGKTFLAQGGDRSFRGSKYSMRYYYYYYSTTTTTTLKQSDLASPNLTAYFVRRRKTLNVEVLNFNVKKLLGQNLLNIL